ncbi:MAG: hypothetical protein AAF762_07990 [Pseudomonadota bacterium]
MRIGASFKGFAVAAAVAVCADARAFPITDDLEAFTVPSVGTSFQSVSFTNTYADPIVVCNGRTVSNANWMPVVRIDNLTGTGMRVRVQKFGDVANDTSSPTVAINEIYCIVSDAGLFQLPDGSWYQAGKVNSTDKNYRLDWNTARTEEVTGISSNVSGTRGVLAQIMTSNDARGQVPHLNNCVNRNQNPFAGGRFCVGRHTGGYATSRASEVVGYIVFQTGNSTFVNDDGVTIVRSAGLTPDIVRSVNNSPPYSFSTGAQMDVGVTTQNGEDGGHGGYTGLYGAAPLAGGQIDMAIDESPIMDRNHTTEFVAWMAFGEVDTSIDVRKDVDIVATADFDLLSYTIEVENTGEVDFEAIALADTLSQGATGLTLTSGPTLTASTDTDGDGELDTDETWTYTATYQLSDDDFDRGDDVENEVEVAASVTTGGPALDPVTATATTELLANPLVSVVKTSALTGGAPIPAAGVTLGDEVVYTYDITNTGNVGLAPVAINDAHFGAGTLNFLSCAITTDSDADSILGGSPFQITRLGAGDVARCTASYTVIQADIDAQ